MNLEEELRAVLSQEAEMRTTPTPDIEGMVAGGQGRIRRRNTWRFGLAAAAALVVVGGIYGVTQVAGGDPDTAPATGPSQAVEAADPPTWPDDTQSVDAGTYRTNVGVGANGKRIAADLSIGGSNWQGSNYPVAYDGHNFAGIGVYQAESVAGGCTMEAGHQPAATEPPQLVQQLTRLPRSDVVQQPTPTKAFGHDATHLRLRIDAVCEPTSDDAAYLVADSPTGLSRGISYFDGNRDGVSGFVIIDFWVVDVDGTTVVVDMFHTEEAPKTLVEQAAAARDSITFVEAE
jgi:hypothetical protein